MIKGGSLGGLELEQQSATPHNKKEEEQAKEESSDVREWRRLKLGRRIEEQAKNKRKRAKESGQGSKPLRDYRGGKRGQRQSHVKSTLHHEGVRKSRLLDGGGSATCAVVGAKAKRACEGK